MRSITLASDRFRTTVRSTRCARLPKESHADRRHPRRRDRQRGDGRSGEGARGRRASFRPAVRARAPAVGRRPLPRDRRHDAAGRLRHAARRSTRSSSARSAIRACPTTATRATSCSARASSSISTSTTGRSSCSTSGSVRSRAARRRTSTSSSFARTPRGSTSASAAASRPGTEDEVAIQEEINTCKGVHRIIRHAFEFAKARGLTKVCMADKSNAMQQGHALWQRVFKEVAPRVSRRSRRRTTTSTRSRCTWCSTPAQFEVIVTNNLFGDIITDLGASAAGRARHGGVGQHPSRAGRRCSSRCTDRRRRFAGKNVANPIGAISSAALMLETLGLAEEARARSTPPCCRPSTRARCTADIGGTLGTREAGECIVRSSDC